MESLYPGKGLFLLNSTNRGGTFKVMPGWNRRRNNPRPSLRTFVVGETLNNVMKPGTCLLYPHNTFNKLTEDYVYILTKVRKYFRTTVGPYTYNVTCTVQVLVGLAS